MGKSKQEQEMEARCARYHELLERTPTDREMERATEIFFRYVNPDNETFHRGVFAKGFELMEEYGSFTKDASQLFSEVAALVKYAAVEIAMYETENGTVRDENMEETIKRAMDTLYQGMLTYWDHRQEMLDKYVHDGRAGGRGV